MTSHSVSVVFLGIEGTPVDVQAHVAQGLPALNIVGMADKSISESKERIRSAFSSIGISLPPKRITVNLAPSSLVKEGSHFDLPIALAILHAMKILENIDLQQFVTMGELSLNGDIKPVNGVLAALVLATKNNKGLIFPCDQINEVHLFKSRLSLLPVDNLSTIISHFKNQAKISIKSFPDIKESPVPKKYSDLSEIKGQETAKRALQVAAAGEHNMLMIGPPGVGKSMLASAIQGILPPLEKKDMLDISLIYSIAGMLGNNSLITQKPFRSPHHTSSEASLIGGGKKVVPGEITLAHKGILFMDELAEFNSHTLNSLREPLETGEIHIARVNNRITFPAQFQLIAAMNPCKCGYLGNPRKQCKKAPICGEEYQKKISGPLLDRIDIVIELAELDLYKIHGSSAISSKQIKNQILDARKIQKERFKNYNYQTNSRMGSNFIEDIQYQIEKNPITRTLMQSFYQNSQLSMRGYNKILKLCRTIADLDGQSSIKKEHLAEAVSYRKIYYST